MEYNKETKTLIIPYDFDEELKDLPEETEIMIFEGESSNNYSRFNQPIIIKTNFNFINYFKVDKYKSILPKNLTHLTFGYSFNKKVDNLPQNITHLTFGYVFNQIVDKLPITIKELSLHCNNNLINNLPEHIEKLFINFYYKIKKVENLPFTLKEIIIKDEKFKEYIKIPFGCILTIQKIE